MIQEEKVSYDEPKKFSLAKFRLYYIVFSLLVLIVIMIFSKEPTPPICYGLLVLFAIYLFLPFTYRLLVSNEAISSVNLLGVRILAWNEIAKVKNKRGDLILLNQDGDVKVTVKQQIDGYPEVIKFIQLQRPDLLHSDDSYNFHQSYAGYVLSFLAGVGLIIACGWELLISKLTIDSIAPVAFIFGIAVFLLLRGLLRIRKVSLDQDLLVITYLFWERQFQVMDISSVSFKQQYRDKTIAHSVNIQIKDNKNIIIEDAQEGNPILMNALEVWIAKYKEK